MAIADLICLADEVISYDEYVLFDPISPWKKKTITNYYYKQLQRPIFVNGQLVYNPKTTEETKQYCCDQMNTIWEEAKRLRNPHKYYVDLSQKLYDLKNELIQKNKKA